MVESGGATAADFRDVFKNNIDKRIKNLPEIDGLRKGFEKSMQGFLLIYYAAKLIFELFWT